MGDAAKEELDHALWGERPEPPKCGNCGAPLLSRERQDGICTPCAETDLED